jgi:hypothetical protein
VTEHSRIGASSYSRWGNCPGSVALSESVPKETSRYAAEGHVAHRVADILLTSNKSVFGAVFHDEGFTFTVDQDMLDAVNVYVHEVNARRKRGDTLLVEHKFHLKSLHPDLFGTADAVLWWPKDKHLTVMDYKHGAGVAVEVDDNKQLMYYALGALMTCGFNARSVTIVIVQPRCPHPDGPVRQYTFEAVDLLDFAAQLVEDAKATEAPDAPLKVGPWCRWCPAAGFCPAQAKHAQALAKVAFDAPAKSVVPPAPNALTSVQIADVLEKLPILEAWIKSVREYAYTEAEAGRAPPRHKLVAKVAHRKFKEGVTAEALAEVAGATPYDFLTEPELLGIAAIEKQMPGKNAAERAAALEPFVTRESTGHVLVHESDRRPAINPNETAKLVFNKE